LRLFPEKPNERYLWKALYINSDGENRRGITWTTASPEAPVFDTAIGNSLYDFFDAPPGKQFRIYMITADPKTIYCAIDDGHQSARINLDFYVHSLPKGKVYAGASAQNQIFHARIYQNETGLDSLSYDKDDDGVRDIADDHYNPLGSSQTRFWDPPNQWIYPNGVDVGPHIMVEIVFGGQQNYNRWAGVLNCNFFFAYDIVPSSKYRGVFGR